MKRTRLWLSNGLLFIYSCFVVSGVLANQRIKLSDGDRVVFLGGTIFDRDRLYGEIETSLSERFLGRRVTFRNIGWDGDTVFGDARAGGRRGAVFGDAAEGFSKMLQHVQMVDPTLLFVAYGAVEAHAGPNGLISFTTGLEHLLTKLQARDRRIVLLTPLRILGEGVPQRLKAASQVDQLNLNLN